MVSKVKDIKKHFDNTLKSISTGLLGFLLFESRCNMYAIYSEYFLYPPILKMLGHRYSNIKNEKHVNQLLSNKNKERLDFFLDMPKYKSAFAIEVKWFDHIIKRVYLKKDITKLKKLHRKRKYAVYTYLLIVVRKSKIGNLMKYIESDNSLYAFQEVFIDRPYSHYAVVIVEVLRSKQISIK